MALISCPECKREVSERASQCPHCGHPVSSTGETDEGKTDGAAVHFTKAISAVVGLLIFAVASSGDTKAICVVLGIVFVVAVIAYVVVMRLQDNDGKVRYPGALGLVLGILIFVVLFAAYVVLKSVVLWAMKFFG